MKAVWSIALGILAWMAPSLMATSQSPRSKDTTTPLLTTTKQIADSTKILYDSALVNKKLLNQVIDSAKDGNRPLKQVVKDSKQTGRQIDQLTKLIAADKRRVDTQVSQIPKIDSTELAYPPIKIDSNWIRKRPASFFHRLFKRP